MLSEEERKKRHLKAVNRWKANNPDKVKKHKRTDYLTRSPERIAKTLQGNRDYALGLRTQVVALLGGACVKCGFNDVRALQIDHVNGGGGEERRTIKSRASFYTKVIASSIGYQLLCANCNWIKRHEQKEFNHWGRAGTPVN